MDFSATIDKKVALTDKGFEVLPMSCRDRDMYVIDEPNENGHVLIGTNDGKLKTFIHFSHIDWEQTLFNN